MRKAGALTVICGSMYAGKSEELIRRARRALYAKRSVQVFKPLLDNRYHDSMVVSHMGAQHAAIPVRDSRELQEQLAPGVDMVCIEEVQFFDEGIADLCVTLADGGVDVVCAGLDQDFRRRPFGPMPRLLCAADEVVKLRAICLKCGGEASHTYRTINGRPAHKDDPVILIGATEAYEARCRACYELRGERRAKRRP